jgi:hypothetical protein
LLCEFRTIKEAIERDSADKHMNLSMLDCQLEKLAAISSDINNRNVGINLLQFQRSVSLIRRLIAALRDGNLDTIGTISSELRDDNRNVVGVIDNGLYSADKNDLVEALTKMPRPQS